MLRIRVSGIDNDRQATVFLMPASGDLLKEIIFAHIRQADINDGKIKPAVSKLYQGFAPVVRAGNGQSASSGCGAFAPFTQVGAG